MSIRETLKGLFQPPVSESDKIQTDLAVTVLQQIPQLREVRIFKTHWDKQTDNINLSVIMEDNNEWSCFARRVVEGMTLDPDSSDSWPVLWETNLRRNLRAKVREIAPRVQLSIATVSDLQKFKKLGGVPSTGIYDSGILLDLHKQMGQGMLVFQKSGA